MTRARKKVLLVQQALNPPGGGISVAAWMAQTLARHHEVTLLTWDAPQWERTNRYYGTDLHASDFRVIQVSPLLRAIRRFIPVPLALIERYVLMRYARSLPGFDLVVSATNELDVPPRVTQYIHFPWGYWPRPGVDLRWYHRFPGVLRLYYAFGNRIAPTSREAIRNNRTLANSAWTGRKFVEKYGGTFDVLYPPITGTTGAVPPWHERKDAFVVAGRLSPEKRLPEVITIIEQVRARGFDVELVIVTSRASGRYASAVEAMASARPWVTMAYDLSRDELHHRFASSKFGIHGMHDEHFGMAIAEMARAGCVVFVHDSGGAAEIVRDPRLRYSSDDDAVEKIVRILREPGGQPALSAALAAASDRFSVEAFCARFAAIVEEELEAHPAPAAEKELVDVS